MAESHFVYWELFPTIDHLDPAARGGQDTSDNWVCTSMVRNSAKSSWTLAELKLDLHPRGNLAEWDGLTKWLRRCNNAPSGMDYFGLSEKWRSAAVSFFRAGLIRLRQEGLSVN